MEESEPKHLWLVIRNSSRENDTIRYKHFINMEELFKYYVEDVNLNRNNNGQDSIDAEDLKPYCVLNKYTRVYSSGDEKYFHYYTYTIIDSIEQEVYINSLYEDCYTVFRLDEIFRGSYRYE